MNIIFSGFRKAHALAEDGEIERLDASEQSAVRMHQQPQCAAAVRVDQAEQRGAFFVELPGAFGFESEQFANAESGFAAAKILG